MSTNISPAPLAISPWLLRWPQACRAGATALDLACGSGRHTEHLARSGMRVTGVDRDAAATAPLQALAEIIHADLEAGPWPLADRQFDLVLVSNYLWRPLLPEIMAAVAPGGWLIYETYAQGQQSIGRPARPEFLLQAGELLRACQGLRVIGYEDGFENTALLTGDSAAMEAGIGTSRSSALRANSRFVQRIAAVRAPAASAGEADVFPRYVLPGA